MNRHTQSIAFKPVYEFTRSPLPKKTRRNHNDIVPPVDTKDAQFLKDAKDLFRSAGELAKKGEDFLKRWEGTNLPHGLEDYIRDVFTTLPRKHADWAAARRALADNGFAWIVNHREPLVEAITSLPQTGPLLISSDGIHQLVDQVYLEQGSRLAEESTRLTYEQVDYHKTRDGEFSTTKTDAGDTVYYARTQNDDMKIVRTATTELDFDIGNATLPSLPPSPEDRFMFPLRNGDLALTTPVRDTGVPLRPIPQRERVFFPPPQELKLSTPISESPKKKETPVRGEEEDHQWTSTKSSPFRRPADDEFPISFVRTNTAGSFDVSLSSDSSDVHRRILSNAEELEARHEDQNATVVEDEEEADNATVEKVEAENVVKGKGKAKEVEEEAEEESPPEFETKVTPQEDEDESALAPLPTILPLKNGKPKRAVPTPRAPRGRAAVVPAASTKKTVTSTRAVQPKAKPEVTEPTTRTRSTRVQKVEKPLPRRQPMAGPSRLPPPANATAGPSNAGRSTTRGVPSRTPANPPTATANTVTRGTKRGRAQVEPTTAVPQEGERPTRRLRSRKQD